jgi:hypothetical protein
MVPVNREAGCCAPADHQGLNTHFHLALHKSVLHNADRFAGIGKDNSSIALDESMPEKVEKRFHSVARLSKDSAGRG